MTAEWLPKNITPRTTPPPREWRYGMRGSGHLYRSTDPRAFPVCGIPIRYSGTAPIQAGDHRCGHCVKVFQRIGGAA